MTKNDQRIVAIIGGFNHEGIATTMKSLGFELFAIKLDGVMPKTWCKRADILRSLKEESRLAGVVLYLHTSLFLKASDPEYTDAFFEILEEMISVKSVIFVYQDNLDGIFAMRHGDTGIPMSLKDLRKAQQKVEELSFFGTSRLEFAIARLEEANRLKEHIPIFTNRLVACGIDIAPFFVRSDVTLRFQEFLEEVDQGVFLRLFVKNDRYQGEQLRSLLAVLERYMQQIEGVKLAIDARKCSSGTIYVFKRNEISNQIFDFQEAFSRFDAFMEMCSDDPTAAETILRSKGQSEKNAAYLVSRFSKDYRRIKLDTRHEYEAKLLLLKQRFETEIIEQDVLVPTGNYEKDSFSSLMPIESSEHGIQVNIGGISIENYTAIKSEIDQIINGGITYNSNDKVLMDLFEKYTNRVQAIQLRSDLDQLKDSSVPEANRRTAKQRILGFLRKVASRGGEVLESVTVRLLSKYLEDLLKGIA